MKIVGSEPSPKAIWINSSVGGNEFIAERLYREYHSMSIIEYVQYYRYEQLFKFKSLDSRSEKIKRELEKLLSDTAEDFLDTLK